jgi:hypothetical protein
MVKPAPTRIKSTAPISLSPVKALSGAVPAEPFEPAGAPQPKPPVTATPVPAPAPKPAEAKPAEAKLPETKALEAKAPEPKPAEAKLPEAKAPEAKAPEAKAPDAKPVEAKPAVKQAARTIKPKAETRVASAKVRVEKPALTAAPKPAPALKPAAASKSSPVPKSVPKPAPAPAAAAPVSREAVAKAVVAPVKTVAQVVEAAVKAAVPVQAKATPAASLITMPLPRPPEFAALTSTTVMAQALVMAKAFGALQAKMLDHACSELKATLGDAETLARTDSAADAVALQAKAVRRSYESYAEHLKELARIASKALGAGDRGNG